MKKASREWAVISKVVEMSNLALAIEKGVCSDWFKDLDAKHTWKFITECYEKHGEVPSEEMLIDQFGSTYKRVDVSDGLGLLIERFRELAAFHDVAAAQKKIIAALDNGRNGMNALQVFQEQAIDLSTKYVESEHLDANQSSGLIRERYKRLKENNGVIGVPTPWETYTRLTGGYQKGVVHGWYGLTGTMKTWMLLYQAAFVNQEYGIVPLMLSKEVPKEQLIWRYGAMRARVEYELYRMAKLSEEDEERLFKTLERMKGDPPFPIDYIVSQGAESVLEVRAKIRKHSPDMVLVDGVYFMATDPSNWGQMAVINNGLKQLAMSCGCEAGFVCSTQRTYEGAKKREMDETDQGDVGFGKSFAQMTDTLARIVRGPKEIEANEACIVMTKSRESMTCKFWLEAKPGLPFKERPKDPDEEEPMDEPDEPDMGEAA